LKIFVTGGAGFIGSEFVRSALGGKLEAFGINPSKVIVYDALTYAGNIDNLSSVEKDERFEFIKGDICDSSIEKSIPKYCDLIVNFAAESHVDRSIEGPSMFVKTNILGTQNLLEVAKKHEVKKFIQISTDEVYGSIESGSWDENFPLEPNSPYAASKACADLLCLAYKKTYGFPVLITRCSNNYGPYQNPEKLIPLFIKNLIEGSKLPLYGDGKNIREWIHVSDHVRAISFAYQYGKNGQIYNIAGDDEKSNIEITKIILSIFGEDESKILYVKDRLGHDLRYALNGNKIRTLGFKNDVNFDEGIINTIEWYKNNLEWIKNTVSKNQPD
jgi:dTDP-glucose 4,6-dehydratase